MSEMRMSGAKAARSAHGSPSGLDGIVRFGGLPRTEAGIYPDEPHAERCARMGSLNFNYEKKVL